MNDREMNRAPNQKTIPALRRVAMTLVGLSGVGLARDSIFRQLSVNMNTMNMKHASTLAILSVVLFLPATLCAAPIAWGPAVDTTDKSQLIEGVVTYAFSGGTGATITGAGASGTATIIFPGGNYTNLDFSPPPGNRTTEDISEGTSSTGDTGFDTVLKSLTDARVGIVGGTQTIHGLSHGATYQIQVFFNDQRAASSGRVMTFGDGEPAPNEVDVAAAGSGWGQHAAGSFTAAGTNQLLTHTANGFGNVHINAILVTGGTPPLPAVPDGLAASPGNNRIILNWNGDVLPGFREFRIHRSGTTGGTYTQIGTSTNPTYIDNTVTNGSTWYYVVTAVNNIGQESGPSLEVAGTPESAPEPPNFLFIITDDQDTYSVGAYRRTEPCEVDVNGAPYLIDTPHIDRLAAEGMLFHQARIMGANMGAVCTPSRTSIMTGKGTWQRTAEVTAAVTFPGIFNRGVRDGLPNLPYATYRTCKEGNSYPTANAEFTTVLDATKRGNTDGNGSEWHGNNAVNFIADWAANHRSSGKPFFIYLGFSHPHDTRNARTTPDLTGRYGCLNTNPAALTMVNPAAPPAPANLLTCTPATYPAHPFDHGHLDARDENSVSGILQYRTEAVVRNEIGRNFACVDWIDQQIGRVLDRLEDPDGDGNTSDSVINNTYIVFTSDHGIAIGRHGLQGKQNLYEHTWRVPYIVRGPGIAPGSETDALVYLHDTFPTFCDLAGLDLPATIKENDGQSFRPVLEGKSTNHRSVLYGLYAGGSTPGIRAVTDGRFKMIKYDVGTNTTQVTQLFDLQTNPFELLPQHGVKNLADRPAYARIRFRLEEALMQQRIENADPYPYLHDRSLWRFETNLTDRLPFGNNGTAMSANAGPLPTFIADTPASIDFVTGEANATSLDFKADNQNYVVVPDAATFDYGNSPFTIEAWVKFRAMPAGDNLASCYPVVQKKVIGNADEAMDYMFLASAGNYGGATDYDKLALHLGGGIVFSSLAVPDNGWHYISVAFDPVNAVVRFSLDDQADTVSTTLSGTANNGPLVIGAHANSSGTFDMFFDGAIDELTITDGFLAREEQQPLLAVTTPGPFQIVDVVFTNHPYVDVTFESDETLLYHIQRTSSLHVPDWTNIRTYVPGTTNTTETLTRDVPDGEGSSCFYFRVLTAD